MRSRIRADRAAADCGSVTAEFAAVVPAVVLVLAFALGAMQLAGEQVRLQAAVAQAARSYGRGDAGASEPIVQVAAHAEISRIRRGELVCVTATAPANLGILIGITLIAHNCALDDGQ
jgi:hypothetical protein